jgi:hypothetical protein
MGLSLDQLSPPKRPGAGLDHGAIDSGLERGRGGHLAARKRFSSSQHDSDEDFLCHYAMKFEPECRPMRIRS